MSALGGLYRSALHTLPTRATPVRGLTLPNPPGAPSTGNLPAKDVELACDGTAAVEGPGCRAHSRGALAWLEPGFLVVLQHHEVVQRLFVLINAAMDHQELLAPGAAVDGDCAVTAPGLGWVQVAGSLDPAHPHGVQGHPRRAGRRVSGLVGWTELGKRPAVIGATGGRIGVLFSLFEFLGANGRNK
jgi:hypothetical protein